VEATHEVGEYTLGLVLEFHAGARRTQMCVLRAGVNSTLGIDSGSGIGAVEEGQNHSNKIHRLSPIVKNELRQCCGPAAI